MRVDGFDWDDGNQDKNERKHGLSTPLIELFFRQAIWVAPDPKHSRGEDRFLAIGRLADGRAVIAAFTIRVRGGKQLIRPISVRPMNRREIKQYEKAFTATDQ